MKFSYRKSKISVMVRNPETGEMESMPPVGGKPPNAAALAAVGSGTGVAGSGGQTLGIKKPSPAPLNTPPKEPPDLSAALGSSRISPTPLELKMEFQIWAANQKLVMV